MNIAAVSFISISLSTAHFDVYFFAGFLLSWSILIFIVSHIALLDQALLWFLRRPFLIFIKLLRLIIILSLFGVVRVLVTIGHVSSTHFSIFRVPLFQKWCLSIFLLILNIWYAMALLRRAARHVLTKLFLLHGKNLDVIVHLNRSLLQLMIIRISMLRLIVYRVSLVTTCEALPLIIWFEMVFVSRRSRVVVSWHRNPLDVQGWTRLLLI